MMLKMHARTLTIRNCVGNAFAWKCPRVARTSIVISSALVVSVIAVSVARPPPAVVVTAPNHLDVAPVAAHVPAVEAVVVVAVDAMMADDELSTTNQLTRSTAPRPNRSGASKSTI